MQTTQDFEKSLHNIPPGERVAKVKEKTDEIAKEYGWEKNRNLSKKNDRTIYSDKDGNHYSVDTRHGRFEKLDKRGKHQGEGEVDLDLNPIKDSKDLSGGHDINI